MAKENGKFGSKVGQQINVRVTNLPSGINTINSNTEFIKQYIENIKDTIGISFASFYTGRSVTNIEQEKTAAKQQAQQRSILGNQNSIYKLLESIKLYQIQQQNYLAKSENAINIIKAKLASIDKKIPDFSVNSATVELSDENLTDIVKSLHKEKDLPKNIFEKLNITLDNILQEYNKLSTRYVANNDTLSNMHKELLLKFNEVNNAKIEVFIKGLEANNIDDLIEFAKTDTDNLLKNANNMIVFFNALKRLEELDIDKSINSIDNIKPLLNSIKERIDKLKEFSIDENSEQTIYHIFGNPNSQDRGILNEIISSLNNIEILKDNRAKEIGKSLAGVSGIFGETLLMMSMFWPMFLLYNKTIGNIDYTKIFKNLGNMMAAVADINLPPENKIEDIKKDIKGIRSIFKSLYIMNLMALPFFKKDKTHFERTAKIFTHLKTLFETIVNVDNSVNASQQMSNIKSGITDINSVLELIRIMDLEKQVNKIGSFDNLQNLFVGSEGIYELFKKINTIKNDKIAAERINDILDTFIKINSIIDTIKKTKVTKSTEQILESIYNLFNDQSKKQTLQKSLKGIFESIKFMQLPDKDKLAKVADLTLDMGNIINLFDEISKKNIDCDKVTQMFDEYIKTIEEIYKKIDERFDNIIQTSNKVDKIKEANKKIKEGLDDCTEMAVTTNSKNDDIKGGIMSLQGMTDFMISAAVVMSIGALFMMLGGGKFAMAALEFGVTLMVFEALVLTPVLMFSKQKKEVMNSINNMNGFIITCTVTLLLGALFMTLGGGNYVKNALAFGIVLSIFEFLVVAPFLAFYNHKSNVMKGLNEFSTFLFTCTLILSIGSLIISHTNGKFIKNALKFGLVLGLFEALVVAPFLLFGLIKGDVFENAEQFIEIVITCTTILLIGALFMSIKNGALVTGAMKFAATLMLFEMMVIAPFLLMNLLKSQVYTGMKLFSGIVIATSIILMVGALFMTAKSGSLWKQSIEFTLLLMAFEVGVILPFLMFNFIKRQVDKGLIAFGAVIFATTTILMMGALFMTLKNGEYAQGAIDFAKLLGLFIGGIGAIAVGLSKWLGKNEIVKMQEFGIFVLLSSVALITGAYVVKNYGFWNTVGYAIILSGFVTIMASIALVVSAIVDNDAIKDMMAFGAFVMLSSLALITGAFFISQYGAESVLQYGIILTVFSFAMAGVAWIVGKAINEKGIAAMTMLGTFLLLASGSLIIGATYIKEYGCESALKFMGLLALYVIGAVGVFALLEVLTPVIIVGIATGALLGVALLTLTMSLMLVNTLFLLDPGGKKLDKNLEVLNNTLSFGLMGTFSLLGLLSPLIIPGSLAAAAMGASLLILGSSLTLVSVIMEHGKEIGNSIDTLNGILSWNLMFTYSILGLLYPLIIPGSISAAAIGVSMLILGASLKATHNIVQDIGEEALKKDIDILSDAVQGIGGLSVVMIGLTVTLTLGLAGLVLFDNFVNTISSSILHMTHAVKEISKEGDMKPAIKQAVENLKAFIDIPNQIFDKNWFSTLLTLNEVQKIKNFVQPMSDVMLSSANAVQSMASLKVPEFWDEKGNPTKYKQLNKPDFELAATNTSMLLSLMAKTFGVVWNGGNIDIEGKQLTISPEKSLSVLYEKNEDAIDNIVDFGIKSGTVIKGLSEGISNLAKLQIPIAWNDNGNPIGYRQLSISDFTKASIGVQQILGAMANSILNTYVNVGEAFKQYNNGKNIFDDMDEDGPFMRTFTASFKMSELIGSVGKAVGDIAKMQIPIDWDPKTGKVTQYETLTTKHFTDMGNGISTILGAVFKAIAGLYTADWAIDGNKNIFDAVASDAWYAGILGLKEASPFERVLGFSFKVSELIANVGKNIKNLALLQIPKYGMKGKDLVITGYENLTPEDFKRMGESVGKILKATILAIGTLKINDKDALQTTLEALKPVSQLISDTADGIVKLASGQVPVLDEKTGKVISYKLIGKTEYEAAGTAIKTIMTAIPNSLADKNGDLMKIYKDDKFKDVIESISSTSGLISSIADSIVKLGSAQIPKNWKDGKPTEYEHINIGEATTNLQSVLGQIIPAMGTAILQVYNNDKEGLFTETPGQGNTPFDIAVRGITGVTKIVSSITDSIVKLGTAQIPTKWDKNGNPIWYKDIKPKEVVKDIKEIFNGTDGNEGILTILAKVIKNASKTFNDEKINDLVGQLDPTITKITKLIGSVSETIVNMASLNIPTEFDKDGNGKKYKKLEIKDIFLAKENIVSVMISLLEIPTLVDTKLTEKKISLEGLDQWKTDIVSYLTAISPVIKTLTSQIDTVIIFNSSYSKLKPGSFKNIENMLNILNGLLISMSQLSIYSSMIVYEALNMNIPNVTEVIRSTMENSAIIVEAFKKYDIDKNKGLFDIDPNNKSSIVNIVSNILSVYDRLAIKLNLIKNSNSGIVSFSHIGIQQALIPIYLGITDLMLQFNNISNIIKSVNINGSEELINKISSIGDFYSAALTKIYDIYKYINIISSQTTGNISSFDIISLSKYLANISDVLSSMFTGVKASYIAFYDNLSNFENTISTITSQFNSSGNTIANSINLLKENIDKLKEIYNGDQNDLYVSSFTDNSIINKISNDIGIFIKTILTYDKNTHENATKLNNVAQNIYNTFSSQKTYGNAFSNNTKELSKFVTTVNSIKTESFDAMTNLINALNMFATKFGNIDQLTDAIANKLVIVLKELTDKLNDAATTMENEGKNQEARKKAIDKSIETIRELMEYPINVKVGSDTTEDPDNGGDGNNTRQTTTPPKESPAQSQSSGTDSSHRQRQVNTPPNQAKAKAHEDKGTLPPQ